MRRFHLLTATLALALSGCGGLPSHLYTAFGPGAVAHPELAEGEMHPDEGKPHGKIDTLEPHPDFQFAGGTLCAWLEEVDQAPEFCSQQQ